MLLGRIQQVYTHDIFAIYFLYIVVDSSKNVSWFLHAKDRFTLISQATYPSLCALNRFRLSIE